MSLFGKHLNGTHVFDKREFKKRLKRIIGFNPKNISLYEAAFIHRSATFVMPDGEKINNERLEYLGDAIIDAILSEYLFQRYPNASEGFLTKIRARIVNRDELNHISVSMGFNEILVKNVYSGGCVKNLYGDALEAFMGALFIDCGYKKAKRYFIDRLLKEYIDLDEIVNTDSDFKSLIYEWGQKHKTNLTFECDEEYNSEQKQSMFSSVLYVDKQEFGKGIGMSKKEAEQEASKQAWMKISEFSMVN